MKIKIITDSTADLSPELLEKYDIAVVPLYVVMGDKTQKDGLEVSPEDIYAYVEKTGKLCAEPRRFFGDLFRLARAGL